MNIRINVCPQSRTALSCLLCLCRDEHHQGRAGSHLDHAVIHSDVEPILGCASLACSRMYAHTHMHTHTHTHTLQMYCFCSTLFVFIYFQPVLPFLLSRLHERPLGCVHVKLSSPGQARANRPTLCTRCAPDLAHARSQR